MKQTVFLAASWKRLAMANYTIDPRVLEPFLPAGTELDFFHDQCYVSLVGFLFDDVRVKGWTIPWHRRFPEVNLRFYVKQGDKRGVVFISELVPKPAISWVANTLYREHYACLPMKYDWKEGGTSLETRYAWKKKGQWQSLTVHTGKETVPIAAGSVEEFITEHYWGYTRWNERTTGAYQVAHPRWNMYPVQKYNIECDFGMMYGLAFSALTGQAPASVLLAEGSAIEVYGGARFKVSATEDRQVSATADRQVHYSQFQK